MPEANLTSSIYASWPIRSQFEGPFEIFKNTSQISAGPSISIGVALKRPMWQGYATLLLIFLIFALIGFTTLLKTDSKRWVYRITAYVSILASALAYSLSIQNTLPQGRFYLSIPEALAYGVIGSATIFMIFTLLSYRTNINSFLADSIAGIFSLGFLFFLFLTFYFARYVDVGPYQFSNIRSTEWTVLAILFGGILTSAVINYYKPIKCCLSGKLPDQLSISRFIDRLGNRLFALWLAVEFWSSLIVAYVWLTIGHNIQLGLFRWLLLRAAENDALLVIGGQVFLPLAIFAMLFIVRSQFRTSPFVLSFTDTFAIMFLAFSVSSFLNSFGLLVIDELTVWVVTSCLGFIVLILFQSLRTGKGFHRSLQDLGSRIENRFRREPRS